jgi:hypothetical protein
MFVVVRKIINFEPGSRFTNARVTIEGIQQVIDKVRGAFFGWDNIWIGENVRFVWDAILFKDSGVPKCRWSYIVGETHDVVRTLVEVLE